MYDGLLFALLVAFIAHVASARVKVDAYPTEIVVFLLFLFLFCLM